MCIIFLEQTLMLGYYTCKHIYIYIKYHMYFSFFKILKSLEM